jgi:hypothetical protein
MSLRRCLWGITALACVATTVAGCAAGRVSGTASVTSTAAPAQVAAAMFVQQWAQTLWGLAANQTGTETPIYGDYIFNPDGSVSLTFTGADGTQAELTFFPDGSVDYTTRYPDGATQTYLQSAPTFEDTRTIADWLVTSSNGLTVQYRSVLDTLGSYDGEDDTVDLTGTARLPSGATQDFAARTDGGAKRTTVHSVQSDGSSFAATVPIAGVDLLPDFKQPTTGTYTGPSVQIGFTLRHADAPGLRWDAMTCDMGEGLTGEFALGASFAGDGRILQNGGLLALMSWTRGGDSIVQFTSAKSSEVSPAGTARDWATHRWQTLAALLAPAPGLAATGVPGSRGMSQRGAALIPWPAAVSATAVTSNDKRLEDWRK